MTPVVSIIGKKNAGKTTLLEKLIRELTDRGLKVGTIKHDAHDFEIDYPGKDSHRHFQAGASQTVITSSQKTAMVIKTEELMSLDHIAKYFSKDTDIILTEGFKAEAKPKIEIFRSTVHNSPLMVHDPSLIAFVSDVTPVEIGSIPCFSLDEIKPLADFIITTFLK